MIEWAETDPEAEARDGDVLAEFTPSQDKFLVEAPIGKGGMGEVFLVTDKDLRRQVAMKIQRRD